MHGIVTRRMLAGSTAILAAMLAMPAAAQTSSGPVVQDPAARAIDRRPRRP